MSAQLLRVNTKMHSCCFLRRPVTDVPAAPGIAGTWCCLLGPLGHVCGGAPCRCTGLHVLSRAHVLAGVRPDLPPGSSVLLNPRAEVWSSLHSEDRHAVRRMSGACPPPACGLSSCCLSSVFCRAEVFHFHQVHRASFWHSI